MKCVKCGADRPAANLTLVDGEPWCPEDLYKKAEASWTPPPPAPKGP